MRRIERQHHVERGGRGGLVLEVGGGEPALFPQRHVGIVVERRFQELRKQGVDTIKPRVLAEMAERDRRDSERAAAPLKAAPDAYLLDISDMDADAAFAAALAFIAGKGFRSPGP